jgi:hypothetical protein
MKSTKQDKQQQQQDRQRRRKQKFDLLRRMRRDPALSPSAFRVAAALLMEFHNLWTGQCNPSIAAISREVGLGRTATVDAIEKLKASGWVTIESTKGGSSRNTNRYKFDLEKTSPCAKTGKLSAEAPETHKMGDEAPPSEGANYEDGHFTEIIEDNEDVEVSSADERQPESRRGRNPDTGCRNPGHEPLKNPPPPSEEEEGGREDPTAARACGAPLKKEEYELAFQQLCQLWSAREVFWPAVDEAKAREAFMAVCAGYGEHILAQHGMDVCHYLVNRAQAWISEFIAAHPEGDGAKYLKRLDVWLGAPDAKGDAAPWWSKEPTPRPMAGAGGRVRKPDLMKVAMHGGRRA